MRPYFFQVFGGFFGVIWALSAPLYAQEESPELAVSEETSAPAPVQEMVDTRILVVDLKAGGEITVDTAGTITGLVAEEVGSRKQLEVLSGEDLRQVGTVVAARQEAGGCGDEGKCLADMASALGARYVVFGSVSNLGKLLVIQLSLLDADEIRSLGRVSVKSQTIEDLPAELTPAVAELLHEVTGEEVPVSRGQSPKKGASTNKASGRLLWMGLGAGVGAATGGLAILAEGVLSDPQSSGDEKASVHGWAPITVGLGALASAGLVTVGLIASGNDAE